MPSTQLPKPRSGSHYFGVGLRRFSLDPFAVNTHHTLRKSPWLPLIGGIVMSLFMSFPFFMMLADRSQSGEGGNSDPIGFMLLPVGIILAITVVICLWNWLNQADITIEHDGFHITRHGVLKKHEYRLKRQDFLGVLLREYTVRSKNSSTTYQVIELVHPTPSLTVPLLVRPSTIAAREEWESLAKALALPALQQSGQSISARDSDSLDETIIEKLDAGKIDTRYSNQSETPDQLSISTSEQDGRPTLIVEIKARRMSRWIAPVVSIVSLTPMLSLLEGVDTTELILVIIVPLAFIGIINMVAKRDKNTPRSLLIQPDRLIYRDAIAKDYGIKPGPKELIFEAIEDIRAERKSMNFRVVADGDQGEMSIGDGISEDTAQWLRDYILASIANADDAKQRSRS